MTVLQRLQACMESYENMVLNAMTLHWPVLKRTRWAEVSGAIVQTQLSGCEALLSCSDLLYRQAFRPHC